MAMAIMMWMANSLVGRIGTIGTKLLARAQMMTGPGTSMISCMVMVTLTTKILSGLLMTVMVHLSWIAWVRF